MEKVGVLEMMKNFLALMGVPVMLSIFALTMCELHGLCKKWWSVRQRKYSKRDIDDGIVK